MIRFKATLLKIVGRIKMKSGYWTAVGAILIPSAMVWILEAPDNWSPLLVWIPALILALCGFLYLHKGWMDIIAEGRQREKEMKAVEKREKQRRRESRATLLVLSYISRRHPMSMPRVDRILKRWAEEEKMSEELKGDTEEDENE